VDTTTPPRRLGWQTAAIVVLFLAALSFLVISHSRSASPTHDETWHLSAGYTYWLWNDYRMSPDHPPFVRMLAALPLLKMDTWPSQTDLNDLHPSVCLKLLVNSWHNGLYKPEGCWGVNQLMFYSVHDQTLQRFGAKSPFQIPTTDRLDRADYFNDADHLVFWSRMPILLLGLLLAVLVFAWARELYGLAGGVLALALCCFDPNIIAHSSLITADVGCTAFMFGAVYFFWRTCRRLSWVNVLAAGLFFGLANATKTSAALLLPIFAVLSLVRVASREPWPNLTGVRQPSIVLLAGIAVVVGLLAWITIWTTYGFRYSAAFDPAEAASLGAPLPGAEPGYFPIAHNVRQAAAIKHLLKQRTKAEAEAGFDRIEVDSAMAVAPVGITGKLLLFAERHRLLPEAYLYGWATLPNASRRTSFLRGEYSKDGFRSYFAWSFVLKTPLPTLVAIALALGFWLRRGRDGADLAFLLLPAAIFFAVCVWTRLNIGHRHILPIYPFLFVLCGSLALEWRNWKPSMRRATAAIALTIVALGSVVVFAPPWRPAVVFPHYLAYFNELAGGPRNGYKQLVDSNLDWGQGLKELKAWLERNGITEPINLCYFGVTDARYYGFPHVNLPGTFDTAPSVNFDQARIPGYVAISATHLQGLYFSEEGRAAWREFLANASLVDTIGYSIFIYRKDAP
jgi:4-amino-4-deoxy-L-arabinose transferase-like glycosyltransferase